MDEQRKPEPSGTPDLMHVGLKVVDVSLGIAALGLEALDKSVKYLSEHGPEWLDEMEERGRPIRREIIGLATGNPVTPSLQQQAQAEPEIDALEKRIRELEKEVGKPIVPQTSQGEVVDIAQIAATVSTGEEPSFVGASSTETESTPATSHFVVPDIDDDDDSPGNPPAGAANV